MTLNTIYAPATYTGDGSTTAFALAHKVEQSSHLSITLDGVSTSAWSATGYGLDAGVTVTFDTAPASGVAIVIQRIVPYTQETDLENFDGNPADVTETQFDLLAMADQQIAERQGRTILAPIGTSLTTNEITGTIDSTARVLTITTDGPAASTLGSLSTTIDTSFTSLASGDYLKYDGASWVNTPPDFTDSTFRIQDNSDATKEIAFEASGITTGTTRTITVPDASGTLLYVGDVLDEDNMASNSAIYPASQQSVKAYVDSVALSKLLYVYDEKADGVSGGTFTSGSWVTRDLNTTATNNISGASLSSNQITLPAGTYYIEASAPASAVSEHRLKLYNVTDTSDEIYGTSEHTGSSGVQVTRSFISGEFTIAGEKTFELQHRCAVTRATTGLGLGSSFGIVNIFTDVKIWKIEV